jgi:FkbM family methyltransferase
MVDIFRLVRRVLLPIFARVNPGDITIRHHYTGDRIRLHSFHHKGYWFYGKRREPATMRLFKALVKEGATVLDIGGHIGYTALYFASLVGPKGKVYVFEPGPNNLPYLKHNTRLKSNVIVIEAAVGSQKGQSTLFMENLSGQNNSLIQGYRRLRSSAAAANFTPQIDPVNINVVTLDDFCREEALHPQFLKIDVEGFELEVLRGAIQVLQKLRPILIAEVLGENCDAAWQLFRQCRYVPMNENGMVLDRFQYVDSNMLFVPEETAVHLLDGSGND